MFLEIVKSYSECTVSHCRKWNTTLLIYQDRMQLYQSKHLLNTFYFPQKEHCSIAKENNSFSNELRVIWSEEVEFLFALCGDRIDLLHVYHFDTFELTGCAILRDKIGGIKDCLFVGEDNLLIQSFQVPNRALYWNIHNGRPLTVLDNVCFTAKNQVSIQMIASDSSLTNGYLVVHERKKQKSGDFRDAFSVYQPDDDNLNLIHQFFPSSITWTISHWKLSEDGMRIFMICSMFEYKIACYSIYGSKCWEFELERECCFVVDLVEVAYLNILLVIDSGSRLFAIDSESGVLVSHFPVYLIEKPLDMNGQVKWESIQVIREFNGEFVKYDGKNSKLSSLFGAKTELCGGFAMCRKVQLSNYFRPPDVSTGNQQIFLVAFILDICPNALYIFDVISFSIKCIFIFESSITWFNWESVNEDPALVIFGKKSGHFWHNEQFGSFSLFDSATESNDKNELNEKKSYEEEVRYVQNSNCLEYFAKTTYNRTIQMKLVVSE